MNDWNWLGDHLAVDFANTVIDDARGRRELTPQAPQVASGLIVLGDQDGAGQCDVDGECR